MRTWRLAANLAVFALVAVVLIAYGVVDLLGNPFRATTDVVAVFPDASGIYTHFTVQLDGVDVGSVTGVHLVRRGAEVSMAIDPGVAVPGDVVASIGIANDLGEQVVDLTPHRGGSTRPLRSGAVIPVAKGEIPVEVSKVVQTVTRLLRAIPAGKLDSLLRQLARGLEGRAGDLRTIVASSTVFSGQLLRYQRQITALLANSPPVMDAVTAAGPQLSRALADTEAIVQVLATHRGGLQGDLTNGQAALHAAGGLVATEAPNLACLVHDLARLNANLAQPATLSNLSSSLSLNRYFFGAVTAVAVTGTAKPLVSGQAAASQTMLRTRLLLPPATPPGDSYATAVGVPAVKPGAGCTTAEFGQGAGPATQPGFQPAAGGTLSPPSQADAQVRGGGDPGPGPAAASPGQGAAYRATDPVGTPALLVLGGVVLPALALAWGVRPSRRRRRRRA